MKRVVVVWGVLLTTWNAQAGFTQTQTITSSSVGLTLQNGVIYNVPANVSLTAGSGASALKIADNATAVVHVPAGVTLTVNGGAASGTTGGGGGGGVVGIGGGGSVGGDTGTRANPESTASAEDHHDSKRTGGGGGGGGSGSVGSGGTLYADPFATITVSSSRTIDRTVSSHSAVAYTERIDMGPGASSSTVSLSSRYGCVYPDVTPFVSPRAGYVFSGIYDGINGTGRMIVDRFGKGVAVRTDTVERTLYVYWILPTDSLHVTTGEDLTSEEAAARGLVSLRSAVASAKEMQTHLDSDKIIVTFADSVTDVVLKRPIELPSFGFSSAYPLRIEGRLGRSAASGEVRLVPTSRPSSFEFTYSSPNQAPSCPALVSGESNVISVRDVAFEGFYHLPGSGGAVQLSGVGGMATFENCAFRSCAASHGGVFMIRGWDVLLSRCTFLDNSTQFSYANSAYGYEASASAGKGSVIRVDGGGGRVTVVQSTFSHNTGGCEGCISAGDFSVPVTLVGCTFAENTVDATVITPTSAYVFDGVAVNTVFADPGATEILPQPAKAKIKLVYCLLGGSSGGDVIDSQTGITDWTGYLDLMRRSAVTNGVGHVWYHPTAGAAAYCVWHDAAWTNVATSLSFDGANKVALRGSAALATELLRTDQLGVTCEQSNQLRAGAVFHFTKEAASLVVTTGDDSVDDTDERISLREAIAYAAAYPQLTNPFTHDRTISFASNAVQFVSVRETLHLQTGRFTGTTDFPALVIDGNLHNLDRAVRLSSSGVASLLDVAAGGHVQLRNLTISGFGQGSAAIRATNAWVRLENVAFKDLYSRAVACTGTGAGTGLEIEGCSFMPYAAFSDLVMASSEAPARILVTVWQAKAKMDVFDVPEGSLVLNSTFFFNLPLEGWVMPFPDGVVTANNLFFGRDSTDVDTTRLTVKNRGVEHFAFMPYPYMRGGWVLHDATWENVALETPDWKGDRSRTALVGSADAAKRAGLKIGSDIRGVSLRDNRAPSLGACDSDKEVASLVVTEETDETNDTNDKVSLREALAYAKKYPNLVSSVNGSRTVSFLPSVTKAGRTGGTFVVACDLTVDGWLGRTNAPNGAVRFDQLTSTTGVRVEGGHAVTLRNLVFSNASINYGYLIEITQPSTDVATDVVVENCSFIANRTVAVIYTSVQGDDFHLLVDRCSFQSCTLEHYGYSLIGTEASYQDGIVVVGCSFVDCGSNYGPLLTIGGWRSSIVNCTFVDCYAQYNCMLNLQSSLAAECLVDGEVSLVDYTAVADLYCSQMTGTTPLLRMNVVEFDNPEAFFAGRRVMTVNGVSHLVRLPVQGILGSFVWHDGPWTSVALSSARDGEKTALTGFEHLSTRLRELDEVGQTHAATNWAPPAGAVFRDTEPASLVVTTESDTNNVSILKSPTTLREAFAAASTFPWLVNSNTLTRTITFVDDVRRITLADGISCTLQAGTPLSVDGRGVTLSGGGTSPGISFSSLVDVSVSDVQFEAFSPNAVNYTDAGDLNLENCAVRNCTGDYSAVFYGGYGTLQMMSCSFTSNRCTRGAATATDNASIACVAASTFYANDAGTNAVLSLQAYQSTVAACTFVKNSGGPSLHNGTVASTLAVGNVYKGTNGKTVENDIRVLSGGTVKLLESYGRYGPGSVKNSGNVTRGAIGVTCSADASKYVYAKPETISVRRVEHTFLRPKESAPSDWTPVAVPLAPGGYVTHNPNWTSVFCSDALNLASSYTLVSTDMVAQVLQPAHAPCAGAVFYGAEEPFSPIVTTTAVADPADYKTSIEEAVDYARSHTNDNIVTFSDEIYDTNGCATVGFDNLMAISNASVEVRAPAGKTTVLAYVPRLREEDDHGADEVARTHAFYILENGSLSLEGVVVSNAVGNVEAIQRRHGDRATSGGGILCYGAFDAVDCTFTCCEAGPQSHVLPRRVPTGVGGAVCTVGPDSEAHLDGCTFENCHAANGGAVASVDGGTMYVTDGTFRGNVAWLTLVEQGLGGAAYREGDDSVLELGGAPVFENNQTVGTSNAWVDVVEMLTNAEGRVVISVPEGLSGPLSVKSGATLYAATPASASALAARLSVANRDWYSATAEGCEVRFALNAQATPVIDDLEAAETFAVTVKNVKPGLRYALGWSDTPGGDFAAGLTDGDWVPVNEDGTLPVLTAPKGDSGNRFYKVLVRP